MEVLGNCLFLLNFFSTVPKKEKNVALATARLYFIWKLKSFLK